MPFEKMNDWSETYLEGNAKEIRESTVSPLNETIEVAKNSVLDYINRAMATLQAKMANETSGAIQEEDLSDFAENVMEKVQLSLNEVESTLEKTPSLNPEAGWFNLLNQEAWWPLVAIVWGFVFCTTLTCAFCCCKFSLSGKSWELNVRKKRRQDRAESSHQAASSHRAASSHPENEYELPYYVRSGLPNRESGPVAAPSSVVLPPPEEEDPESNKSGATGGQTTVEAEVSAEVIDTTEAKE